MRIIALQVMSYFISGYPINETHKSDEMISLK